MTRTPGNGGGNYLERTGIEYSEWVHPTPAEWGGASTLALYAAMT